MDRYELYKNIYSNCTHVDGNLEIVFIDVPEAYNLNFLSDIEEVSGYVLIVGNYADYIPLKFLKVIRGNTLFEHENKLYSLYVALNYDPLESTVGLKELQLLSLQEIQHGSVFLFHNNQLCHEDSIDWSDIFLSQESEVVRIAKDYSHPHRTCGECDEKCQFNNKTFCWGDGPQMCQKLKKQQCSPQCNGGNCFGPLPYQCCHDECIGGCSGPTKRDCWSCKNFENEGSCEKQCPPEHIYSPSEFKQIPNPHVKYAYGNLCVSKCPSHLIIDEGACVKECGAGRYVSRNATCVDCDGPCPKICKIDLENDFVHSGNLEKFRGCTVVQGRVKIFDSTFHGDPYNNIKPMSVNKLSVLETVKEVTEFVQIQANVNTLHSLWFLKNLKVIHGRRLDRGRAALQIWQTSLEHLGMASLKHIKNGHIFISNNSMLCHVDGINWTRFLSQPTNQQVTILHNKDNKLCERDHKTCSSVCSDEGCWGDTDDQCVSCRFVSLNHKKCLVSCQQENLLYKSGSHVCKRCHPQCRDGCYGSSNNQCRSCLKFKDGPYCVDDCPSSKYPDQDGVCRECHKDCDVEAGCTGPTNVQGQNGCNVCNQVMVQYKEEEIKREYQPYNQKHNKPIQTCMPINSICPSDHYRTFVHVTLNNTNRIVVYTPTHYSIPACVKCHSLCKECSGPGISMCTKCLHYMQEDTCVEQCSKDYFVKRLSETSENLLATKFFPSSPSTTLFTSASSAPSTLSTSFNGTRRDETLELDELVPRCTKCDSKCLQCIGTPDNCTICKHYKLMHSEQEDGFSGKFTCVEECPLASPYRITRTTTFFNRMKNITNLDNNNDNDDDNNTYSENFLEIVCSKHQPLSYKAVSSQLKLCGVLIVIFMFTILVVMTIVMKRKKQMNQKRVEHLTQCVTEMEPLSPSNIEPDMSIVRLAKLSELKIGQIIGSGAFGTVYQGLWMPENGQPKPRMLVAIKVLMERHDESGSKELLDEARIMASVDHTCCVRILCVCLSSRIMLITDLVNYGCMLDFVRKHKECLGESDLLLWSLQIASGMLYLSKKGIIHRDLAARNVLVESLEQVKITDFGLAKLIDDIDKISSQQTKNHTKMPIKWLAYESITCQQFTHQSDVWSFGVTLWELITFGKRPYDNIHVNDLVSLLENGARLEQPDICGSEVYLMLTKCWSLNPSQRPTFAELQEQLHDMNQQPGKYFSLPLHGNRSTIHHIDEGYRTMRPSLEDKCSPIFQQIGFFNSEYLLPTQQNINGPSTAALTDS